MIHFQSCDQWGGHNDEEKEVAPPPRHLSLFNLTRNPGD